MELNEMWEFGKNVSYIDVGYVVVTCRDVYTKKSGVCFYMYVQLKFFV